MVDQIAITRTVTVAAGVFAPGHLGELTRLMPFEMVDEVLTATCRVQQRVRLHAGMLLLADRNYAAADLIKTLAATKAALLIRCKSGRRLPIIHRHRDGSWLSTIGTTRVRVIDAQIAVTTTDGTHTGSYRLIATLLDPHPQPTSELIKLYHQRWEIETAYLELKSSILAGRVLRARTPDGIDQEIHALLTIYQALRTAMVDAPTPNPAPTPTGPASPPH